MASDSRYLQGNIAAAEGALAAGCDFYAGYPITPSSEIMHELARRLPEAGGRFIQMEDELGSIAAVVGASWAGARAMTATSGPGFSLMMETLGYAVWTETPCVLVDVQRAGPCTGQATRVGSGDVMQAHYGSHGDYELIALAPWSVQEMYDLTIRCFDLAERFRVPALLMAEEATGHLRENCSLRTDVRVSSRRKEPGAAPFGDVPSPLVVPPMPSFGEGERLMVTGSTHDARGVRQVQDGEVHAHLVDRLRHKILDARDEIVRVHRHDLDDAEVAVVAYGFTARSALGAVRALRSEGRRVGLLRLETLWPFPDLEVRELADRVGTIFVPEMNWEQVASQVQRHARCDVVTYGQTDGEAIAASAIAARLEELLP